MLDSAVRFRLHFPLRDRFQQPILHVQADGPKPNWNYMRGALPLNEKRKTHPVRNARCEGQALQTGPRSNSQGDGIASQRARCDAFLASVAKRLIGSSVSSGFEPWVDQPNSPAQEREADVEQNRNSKEVEAGSAVGNTSPSDLAKCTRPVIRRVHS